MRRAAGWVRLLEERQEVTIVDVQLAAAALAAPPTASHDRALSVLRPFEASVVTLRWW